MKLKLTFLATIIGLYAIGQSDNPCASGSVVAPALAVGATCSYTTGTTVGAGAQTNANNGGTPTCGSMGNDVWYSFTAPATGGVTITTQSGVVTDGVMALYSGSCGSWTQLTCDDDGGTSLMPLIQQGGLTPGQTYLIRFWEYGGGNDGTFDICVTEYTPPPPATNDDCSNAISITVTEPCIPVSGTVMGATASAQTNGCFGTADDDVWFLFTATSAATEISLNNIAGSTTDMYFSVYSGTCGSPGSELICSDANSNTLTGLVVGNTYLIRVYTYTSTGGQTSTFDLCVTEMGDCGTPENQDYCVAPAVLTSGGGNFSSNTSDTYTQDLPANLNSIFCGSIENNSWYAFVAGNSTELFNFSVSNCSNGWGIQAEVYDVTTDANGCCTNFTSMSNCFNPATDVDGTVTATGLTPGNTYYLMVDGNAGDVCDFTVDNWSATGVLSVQLTQFGGVGLPEKNIISWTTESEIKCNFYEVQRSFDGKTFETFGKIIGNGTTNFEHQYSFVDENVRVGVVYYRLHQVDFDGNDQLSEVIQIKRSIQGNGITALYPNPAKNKITIEVNLSKTDALESMQLISPEGKILQLQTLEVSGFNRIYFDVSKLDKGVYFIKLITNNEIKEVKRFIKQ